MKISMIVFMSILLSLAPLSLNAAGIEIAIGGWYQSPSGDFSYEGVSANDELDLEDDLNYDDEFRFMGRLKIDMPLFFPNIYLMATQMEWDETGQKSVDFKFGDTIFSGNEIFDTELQLNHIDFALFYGISPLKKASLGVFNIDLGLNVKIVDFEAEIEQTASGIKESESFVVPIPTAYVGAQIKPWESIALEFEGRGITFGDDTYIGLIGRLKIKPVGPLFIAAGYRYETLDFEEHDVDVDADFGGPFAEVGFEF
jgi:outer membrane protein